MHDGSGISQPEPAVAAAPRRSDNAPERSSGRWQSELAGAVRSLPELLRRLNLLPDDVGASEAAHRAFPVLVTESYLARMQPGDPRDPLLLQVLPQSEEMKTAPGFTSDPVDDAAARAVPGLLQKYSGRALLLTTGACAIHCRYCFRREYPYSEEPRSPADWQPALDAIASDDSIDEVLLSGGDPLTLTDRRLREMIGRIAAIDHVRRIRIHTRLPIVLPSRVTGAFIDMLLNVRSNGATPIVVVHANHANEIVDDCEAALARLIGAGVTTLNQAVLLAGVNDTADAQVDLSRRLINVGVIPYYLHQLDRVRGTHHFEVSPNIGRDIISNIQGRLPGYAIPRYVAEIPGRDSKTPLH